MVGIFRMNARLLLLAVAIPMVVVSAAQGEEKSAMKVRLMINGKAVTATMLDNATARDFLSLLPVTLKLDPTYAFIGRRVVEGGPRRYNQSVETWYGTATLDGQFDMFSRNWFWDINGVYGHNKAKQTMFGNVNAANLSQALGPVEPLPDAELEVMPSKVLVPSSTGAGAQFNQHVYAAITGAPLERFAEALSDIKDRKVRGRIVLILKK